MAAAKASKRLEKATANNNKKKTKATSNVKSSTSISPNEVHDSSSDDPSDTDASDTSKSKKSKSCSSKNSNYYDPLKQRISQMSKTERKQHKQIQREYRTYCGVNIDIPDNDDDATTMVK